MLKKTKLINDTSFIAFNLLYELQQWTIQLFMK